MHPAATPAFRRKALRKPRPGPLPQSVRPVPRSAAAAIFSRMFRLIRKFCPSPCRAWSPFLLRKACSLSRGKYFFDYCRYLFQLRLRLLCRAKILWESPCRSNFYRVLSSAESGRGAAYAIFGFAGRGVQGAAGRCTRGRCGLLSICRLQARHREWMLRRKLLLKACGKGRAALSPESPSRLPSAEG